MKKFIKIAMLSAGLLGVISPAFAQTNEKTTCYMFKANKFLGKKPCTVIDYQTLGDAYTNEYRIQGFGKFASYGGLDHDTMKEYSILGDKPSESVVRLRSNYKIVKGVADKDLGNKKYLTCVRQIKGIEICTQ